MGRARLGGLRLRPSRRRRIDRREHVPLEGHDRSDLATARALAPGSTVAMTFLLPIELLDERDRAGLDTDRAGCPQVRHPVRELLHT